MAKKVRNGLTQKQRKSQNKRIAQAVDIYEIRPNRPMGRDWKTPEVASQPTGAASAGLTDPGRHSDLPEDAQGLSNRNPADLTKGGQ